MMAKQTVTDMPQPALRVFVVCDQDATAPIWGYIIREKGLVAVMETSVERAMKRTAEEIPDLTLIDVNVPPAQRIELCRKIRSVNASPILLFLPSNNEQEILDAYQAGVDECVVKPISPAIFQAKLEAWTRRSSTKPSVPRRTGKLRLNPAHRSAVGANKKDIKLTNLEFRLMHLLMSRPGYVFPNEEIIEQVWGANGDVILLKNVVYRLRKKLEEESGQQDVIQTWPGGYSFSEE